MKSVFSLEHVSYTYPASRQHAIYHIDMEVPQHRVTAVLGPNGAGKSTLLDLLLGWKTPEKGSVSLKGQPIHSYTKREMGKLISLVPQNEPLQFSFSILDYVLFGRAPYLPQLGRPSEADFDIAYDALHLVNLNISPQRAVTSLSGGQRQLLMLARAIAQRTEIVLLDEPTSSLDPGNTAKVISILNHLVDEGRTIIYTTHDPNFAAETADSIAMLKRGKLLSMLPKHEALVESRISSLYDTPIDVISHDNRHIVYRKTR